MQAALSESGAAWGYVDAELTYAILPAGRWGRKPAWPRVGWVTENDACGHCLHLSRRRELQECSLTGRPEWLMPVNNVLVLPTLGSIGATGVRQPLGTFLTVLVRVARIALSQGLLSSRRPSEPWVCGKCVCGIEFLGILTLRLVDCICRCRFIPSHFFLPRQGGA